MSRLSNPANGSPVGALTRKRGVGKAFWRQKDLHMMLLPLAAAVILFNYLPMYGVIIAFKNYKVSVGIWDSPWARSNGFEHFIDFFVYTPNVVQIVMNTLIISLLKLLFLSFPPVILAIILNEIKFKTFKKITQTISYIPHFISWVVLGGIITSLLSSNGVVNQLLVSIGIQKEPVLYLGNPQLFRPLLILSELWKEVGWGSVLYLAVISTIDPNLYEAVDVDGGGRWSKIWHVTWPSALGVFVIQFIMQCGKILSGMGSTFEQIYILGNPSVYSVSQIIDTYILRVGIENARYSFASAIGLLKNFLNLLLLVSANQFAKKLTGKSLY